MQKKSTFLELLGIGKKADGSWKRLPPSPENVPFKKVEPKDGSERRRTRRAKLVLPVELEVDDPRVPKVSKTADLSIRGMFVAVSQPPPIGSLVKFKIRLDQESVVSGFAHVTWIRIRRGDDEGPAGMGLEYRYLSDLDTQRLAEAVDRHFSTAT